MIYSATGSGDLMKSKYRDWRLGDLLMDLGLLTETEVESALRIAQNTGMPLGSVLLVSGQLTKEELRAVIQAQSMLKDKLVDEDKLMWAMGHLKDQPLGLEGALRRINWHRDSTIQTNKLGELLLAAKVLSHLQLAKGLVHNRNSLQPLGKTLVLLGALSPRALKHALVIQERIRKGELSRSQGVKLLEEVCAKNKLHVDAMNTKEFQKRKEEYTRLGDLLIEAGWLREEEFSIAMEFSASKARFIGEILLECGFLTKEKLDAALDIQRLLSMNLIEKPQAISSLRSMEGSTTVWEALDKNISQQAKQRLMGSEAIAALSQHMTGLDLEDNSQIDDQTEEQEETSKKVVNARSLKNSKAKMPPHIDKKKLREVVEQLYLDVLNGVLDVEQAMIVLNICLTEGCTVSDAIAKLGWTVAARPFRSHDIKLSDDDLIEWLTSE